MFPVLIYDGDCSFCTRAAEWTKAHVRPDATILAYQEADLWALGVNPQACQRSVQWVARPCTEALTEGSAIAAVLRSGRRPWRWLGRVLDWPGIHRLADFGYRKASTNRHRLPGTAHRSESEARSERGGLTEAGALPETGAVPEARATVIPLHPETIDLNDRRVVVTGR